MSDDGKPIANSAALVQALGEIMQGELCGHQAYFVIVLDDHSRAMPCVENVMSRPAPERSRMADVLRMWAGRIESGRVPAKAES